MSISEGLIRAEQINGAGIATINGQRRHTWSEFTERVARLAGALQSLGLRKGGRVAILALNSDYYLEYYFAVIWAGGIIVPLNTRLAVPELVYMLNDATAEILVVDDSHKNLLSELLNHTPTIKQVILAGEGSLTHSAVRHEEILAAADPVPDTGSGENDVAGIFYTGGTTGNAKGVMLTHNNIVSNTMSLLSITYDGEPWTYLHTAPMFHIADSQWNTGITLITGTHVFTPGFNPEETLKTIARNQITYCVLVPTMVNMLCQVSDVDQYDVSSLKVIHYGGSPMPAAVISKAREVFPDCQLIQGYGQTETAPNISMLLDKYHTLDGPNAGKIESAGQVFPAMEVRIVDARDREVPQGTIGEITARGPHVMAGYWNKPEETAQALRGGWMHTGDVGYIDEDRFIYIVDRLKDMIVSGGENVYSTEVENAIYQHTAVAMCAVIGIPSDKWGESVHAIVVPKKDHNLTEEEIINHCRQYIASYKCPRSVDIRSNALPMSGAGKILKKELRAPFWKGKARQVN